jgi:hypothetical protein
LKKLGKNFTNRYIPNARIFIEYWKKNGKPNFDSLKDCIKKGVYSAIVYWTL